jgi:Helicase associated domain
VIGRASHSTVVVKSNRSDSDSGPDEFTQRKPSCAAMRVDADSQPSNPRELAWENGFAALKRFKAREKNCRVPRVHLEGVFNLGTWVVNQRNRRGTLSVQRRQRLDAIGFDWTLMRARDSWETGFAALKQFQSREGHCRVPEGHKEGSVKLGSWVQAQRSKRKGMSTACRRQLDAIKFVWDPNEDAWRRGFAVLKQFKAREKHCRVPRGHLEGAYNLGTWVVNQRNRRDTLSVQRRQRLDAIGFVWRLT